jgi:hypothetical protein
MPVSGERAERFLGSADRRPIAAAPPAHATAAPGDPLASAECRRALAALNAEEAVVAESSRAGGGVTANDRRLIDARLAPMRRQAARACLARRADPRHSRPRGSCDRRR